MRVNINRIDYFDVKHIYKCILVYRDTLIMDAEIIRTSRFGVFCSTSGTYKPCDYVLR